MHFSGVNRVMALVYGLKMACEMGIRKLIVEIDSLQVYSWVKGVNGIENSLSNVIQECRFWLNKSWVVSIKHVYREGNQVGDQLAKMALKSHHNTLLKWRGPSREVFDLLQRDMFGLTRPKSQKACKTCNLLFPEVSPLPMINK